MYHVSMATFAARRLDDIPQNGATIVGIGAATVVATTSAPSGSLGKLLQRARGRVLSDPASERQSVFARRAKMNAGIDARIRAFTRRLR